MGKSSWKRRVKETAQSGAGSASGEGHSGWRYRWPTNPHEDLPMGMPLHCGGAANEPCRCGPAGGGDFQLPSRDGRPTRTIGPEDLDKMSPAEFAAFTAYFKSQVGGYGPQGKLYGQAMYNQMYDKISKERAAKAAAEEEERLEGNRNMAAAMKKVFPNIEIRQMTPDIKAQMRQHTEDFMQSIVFKEACKEMERSQKDGDSASAGKIFIPNADGTFKTHDVPVPKDPKTDEERKKEEPKAKQDEGKKEAKPKAPAAGKSKDNIFWNMFNSKADKKAKVEEGQKAGKASKPPPATEGQTEQQDEKKDAAKGGNGEKKKKRRKKLTAEEIAAKAAEGMKRRAKKPKTKAEKTREWLPAMRPIEKVAWFREVFRGGRRPGRDDPAVLAVSNLAESLRPRYKRVPDLGPVTLRQFVDMHPTTVIPQMMDVGGPTANQRGVQRKEAMPFWTRPNLELVRGLALAGFEFKLKKPDGAAGRDLTQFGSLAAAGGRRVVRR